MKKWVYRVLATILTFGFLFYFGMNDIQVFHTSVGVLNLSIGLVAFAISITASRLGINNILTRIAPGLMMSSFLYFLYSITISWTGIVQVEQVSGSRYFLTASSLAFAVTIFIRIYTYQKEYNHMKLVRVIIVLAALISVLVIIDSFRNMILLDSIYYFLMLLSSVVLITSFIFSYKRDIEYVEIVRTMILISILAHVTGPFSDQIEFYIVTHSLIFVVFLINVISIITKNITNTLFIRFTQLSEEISKLEENNATLQQTESIFRSLYEDAPIGYQSLDSNANFLMVNQAYAQMMGYKVNELIGTNFSELLTEDSLDTLYTNFPKFKETGEIVSIFDMKKKNGEIITVKFFGKIATFPNGEFRRTHCIMLDISNDIEYQNSLIESREKITSVLASTGEGIIGVNKNGICNFVNRKALELLGRTEEEVIGVNLHTIFHENEIDPIMIKNCYLNKMINDNVIMSTDTEKIFRADGTWFSADISNYPQKVDGKEVGAVYTFRDISSAQELSQSLVQMSYTDHLTGLYNRRFFEKELVVLDKSDNYPLAIINADINGLKMINDAFGHFKGDELLIKAAKVFSNHAQSNDLVARIGGDEFIIVLIKTSSEEVETRISKMKELAKNTEMEFMELSISFGYALKETVSEDISETFKRAEDAMYRDKLLQMPSMRSSAINTMMSTLYENDPSSESHSRRVSTISAAIAKAMKLPSQDVQLVQTAGLLHDIGKIVIPSDILTKDGKLTDEEYEIIKNHPEIGYRILYSTDDTKEVSKIILSHHEWFNGSGYPRGIQKDEIPLLARIICVADSFDAMTNYRTYRSMVTDQEALKELKRCSGTQFDPEIVKVFVDNFEQIQKDGKF